MSRPVSLKDRLVARRAELQKDNPVDVDVQGFPGLVARYRGLDWDTQMKIEQRHEKVKNPSTQLLYIIADKLLNANVGLFERHEDDTLEDLGMRWGIQAAAELFDLQLSDGVTARQAFLTIFSGTEDLLVEHAVAYREAIDAIHNQIDTDVEGESQASSTQA